MTPSERLYFRLYATQPGHKRRVEEARRLIERHPRYAVSVSWGKDSTVVLALSADVHGSVIGIHGRYREPAERLTDLDEVRDSALSRLNVDYHEVEVPGEWDVFERVGHAFRSASSREEKRAIAWWDREFADRMRAAAVRLGCPGYSYGYRTRESRARKINVAMRGSDYLLKDGFGSLLPLAKWTSDDVWAYLVTNDLPWPRIYDIAANRERMRSDFTWTVNMFQWGQEAEWRRAYPELFDRWIERWPELKETTS